MATQDNTIFDIEISLGVSGLTRAGFGTPMLVASSSNLEAGFTERVRTYSSIDAVNNDPDLGTATVNRLLAMFGVDRVPSAIKVGRREADVAQVNTYTVTGATDGTYTITLNGVDFSNVASGSTVTAIRDALVLAINGGSEPVTAAPVSTDQLTVTADVAGTSFSSATASTGDPITDVATTASVSIDSEMALIKAADADFFHHCYDTRTAIDITRGALFATANDRMLWAQSSDSDIITSVTTDVYSVLAGTSNRWVHPMYYTDNAEFFAERACAYFSANDYDTEAPTASLNILAGLPTDTAITDTAAANLRAKGVTHYIPFKGVACTTDANTSAGFPVELVVTGAWTEARMTEAIASVLLTAANSGSRVRFNDLGFARIDGTALVVLKSGETIGHFNVDTSVLEGTERADVPPADVATGTYRFEFGTQYSGRVKNFVIRGAMRLDFVALSA